VLCERRPFWFRLLRVSEGNMISILQCPVCRELTLRSETGCQCANKHTFDAARQGYVNFLLAHKKNSREPGDNRGMIQSRRRFLDRGHYDRVSDGINEAIIGTLQRSDRAGVSNVLDAGCGEGFYLNRLTASLSSGGRDSSVFNYFGVDISKYAVQQATQRDRTMNWFVASIIDLPFTKASLDIVLNVFSPVNFPEFARILNDSGKLVIAHPGPRHLNGLREVIYPVAREHDESDMVEQAKGLFSLSKRTRVNYQLGLTRSGEIMDLLAMTPYYWNIDLSTRSRMEALDRLTLDVDVMISVFSKTGG
jgi:23S rRNA (guanine745-N1)-methyltransferase